MSQIYRPAPRPAVKPPAPRPAMPMSRPAPRPMAKPTTPPPMGGMAGRGPAAAPRPVAKPQAQPGMMGALQSRLQGARPQQKPMGQPEVQVRMPQGSGYTKTAANRIGQPMGQPAGELAVLRQEPAVLKAGPDYLVGQQQGMIEEREITKRADNYPERLPQSMGGGDDMGDIRSQVRGATSVGQQQQALGQLRSAAGSRPEMQQLMSQAREFGVDENQALMDPE